MNAVTQTGNYVLLIKFQEDNLNCEDGVSPLKKFQIKDEAIFGVQIILGATVGGKITRYPQRREIRPAKMFKT